MLCLLPFVRCLCTAPKPFRQPHLSCSQAFITAARYQIDADKAWPIASGAFDKVSGLPVASIMGEKALKPLIEKTISGGVTQNMQAQDCVKADRFINILQPLPTRNMAMLITTLIETGSPATRARLPITLCAAPTPVPTTGASSK
jgi:hypothetical protein